MSFARLEPVQWSNPSIPKALASIIHKAAALSPDDRYDSAGALAEDLRRYLDGRPVKARPYDYNLDAREIAAIRPQRVLLSASCYFFQSMMMLMLIPDLLVALPNLPNLRQKIMNFAVLVVPSLAFLVLGRGILMAGTARILLSILISAIVVLFLAKLAIDTFGGPFDLFQTQLVIIFLLFNLASMIALMTPRTIAWVRASRTIRRRYRRPKQERRELES